MLAVEWLARIWGEDEIVRLYFTLRTSLRLGQGLFLLSLQPQLRLGGAQALHQRDLGRTDVGAAASLYTFTAIELVKQFKITAVGNL